MPSDHELKRLHDIQVDQIQPISWASFGKNITTRDLLLLLRHDPTVQQLIRTIVLGDAASVSTSGESIESSETNARSVQKSPHGYHISETSTSPQPRLRIPDKPDALRTELAPELALLTLVENDPELARAWLGDVDRAEAQGRQLVRLIAVASQWSQILLLWDRLASRCRDGRRKVTADELKILRISLDLHNLIWDGKSAEMQHADQGEPFNHDRHERGRSTGDSVRNEWLPGLVSAAGLIQRKILVET